MGKALSALATVTTIGVGAAIESEFWPPVQALGRIMAIAHWSCCSS
jgi:hypothetical protein